MRGKIVSVGISTDRSVTSAIQHSVIAAQQCIQNAGIDMQEVDYLFNVGVMRDHNMVEPSMAALIQKGIGINRDFIRFPVPSPAFSTDITSGASGALTAFHITDSLFKAGRNGYVLIVSGDSHPSGEIPADFPVRPSGSAFLLKPSDCDAGFQHFAFDSTDGELEGESTVVDFDLDGTNGRNTLHIRRDSDFHDRLLQFCSTHAKRFMADQAIDPAKTLLIGPSFNEDFVPALGRHLSLAEAQCVNTFPEWGDTHTSSFGFGYAAAQSRGLLAQYPSILFVGGGAGMTASCALYRHDAP